MAMSFCPHIVIILSKERVAWIRRFWYIIGLSPSSVMNKQLCLFQRQSHDTKVSRQVAQQQFQPQQQCQDDQYLKISHPTLVEDYDLL